MRVAVLYHPKSEHSGVVEDFATEFKRYKNKALELISLESVKGADMAKLYDVTNYPAVLAMNDSGSLQRLWQGMPLPLMDELSYYCQPSIGAVSHFGKTIILPTASVLR